MARTPSTMLALGTPAPDFRLRDFDGLTHALADFREARALLVVFICGHCPFVQHVRVALSQFARDFQPRGLAIVAINSNDITTCPQDGPDGMRHEAHAAGYVFPYLFDADQSVAKAYRAACTPDFFLFDDHRRLAYRGQFDESRPGNGKPVTGSDLRAAAEALLAGQTVLSDQSPSVGCNIQWRAGNAPDYAR